jgi:hypothetical protein
VWCVRDAPYVDKDGKVWQRDKSEHGGPHWDVEDLKRGTHRNVDDDGMVIHGS